MDMHVPKPFLATHFSRTQPSTTHAHRPVPVYASCLPDPFAKMTRTLFLMNSSLHNFDENILITEGNKTDDGMSTIYRIKSAESPSGPQVNLQFGESMLVEDQMVGLSLLRFSDKKKDDDMKQLLVVQVDEQAEANVLALMEAVGKKLYAGRDVYFNGHVNKNMSFDEFMSHGTVMIKPNRLTGAPEMFLKTRASTNLFQAAVRGDKVLRRKLPMPSTQSSTYRGMACVTPGVHAGMNKGVPRWGVFLMTVDAYLMPAERISMASSEPRDRGCSTGAEVEDVDENDDVWGPAEAANEPVVDTPKRKRIEPTHVEGSAAKRAASFTHNGVTRSL
jgi:hypothetical protein